MKKELVLLVVLIILSSTISYAQDSIGSNVVFEDYSSGNIFTKIFSSIKNVFTNSIGGITPLNINPKTVSILVGDVKTFTASGSASYRWYISSGNDVCELIFDQNKDLVTYTGNIINLRGIKSGNCILTLEDRNGNKIQATVEVKDQLNTNPELTKLLIGESKEITASGGYGNYIWSTTSTSCSIEPKNVLPTSYAIQPTPNTIQPPATPPSITAETIILKGLNQGNCDLILNDAKQNTLQKNIEIVNADKLRLTPEFVNLVPRQSQTMYVNGGIPPYQWNILEGDCKLYNVENIGVNSNINSDIRSLISQNPGTCTIEVKDTGNPLIPSQKSTSLINIITLNTLAVTPDKATLIQGEKQEFIANTVVGTDKTRALYETFDNTQNNIVEDSSYSNNGIISGDVDCSVQGVKGKACSFNNGFIKVQNSEKYNLTKYTIEFWIKNPKEVINQGAIFKKSLTGNKIVFGLDSSIHIFNENNVEILKSSPLNVDKWSHIVLVSEPRSLRIYVNSIEDNEVNFQPNLFSSNNDIQIGADNFNGILDEFAIYSRALSDEEISRNYNGFNYQWSIFNSQNSCELINVDGFKATIHALNPGTCNLVVNDLSNNAITINLIVNSQETVPRPTNLKANIQNSDVTLIWDEGSTILPTAQVTAYAINIQESSFFKRISNSVKYIFGKKAVGFNPTNYYGYKIYKINLDSNEATSLTYTRQTLGCTGISCSFQDKDLVPGKYRYYITALVYKDAFKESAPSDTVDVTINQLQVQNIPSNSGSSSGGSSSSGSTQVTCSEKWLCGNWNTCQNNKQTRDCVDLNNCGNTIIKTPRPYGIRTCVNLQAPSQDQKVSDQQQVPIEETSKTSTFVTKLLYAIIIIILLSAIILIVFRRRIFQRTSSNNVLISNDVVNAVKTAKRQGFSDQDIINGLREKGWSNIQIKEIMTRS